MLIEQLFIQKGQYWISGYALAALAYGDNEPHKHDHMEYLASQMTFVTHDTSASSAHPMQEVSHFLKIYSRHLSSVMTFVNKHARFTENRCTLPNPPVYFYGPDQSTYLEAARHLVRQVLVIHNVASLSRSLCVYLLCNA